MFNVRCWSFLLLALMLAGCAVMLLPVMVDERIEQMIRQPATRPWHFEGQHVVYD